MLRIYGLSIDNLDFLKCLPDLKVLLIEGCNLNDISALAECLQLESVSLAHNNITDISVFDKAVFPNLGTLDLSYNMIEDLSPLNSVEENSTVNYLGIYTDGNPGTEQEETEEKFKFLVDYEK